MRCSGCRSHRPSVLPATSPESLVALCCPADPRPRSRIPGGPGAARGAESGRCNLPPGHRPSRLLRRRARQFQRSLPPTASPNWNWNCRRRRTSRGRCWRCSPRSSPAPSTRASPSSSSAVGKTRTASSPLMSCDPPFQGSPSNVLANDRGIGAGGRASPARTGLRRSTMSSPRSSEAKRCIRWMGSRQRQCPPVRYLRWSAPRCPRRHRFRHHH